MLEEAGGLAASTDTAGSEAQRLTILLDARVAHLLGKVA
jgi:hypothetical protein